jgi:hypothetical protein
MKCPNCGNEIRPQARFCGRCGAPRPQLPSAFAQAEARLEALRREYEAGLLDRAGFEARRQGLAVRGPDGAYWSPGGDGRWFRYEGSTWVEREPPLEAIPASPAYAPPAAATPQPARATRRIPWLWLAIGGIGIVAVLACVTVVLVRYGPTWLARGEPTPTAAPPATAPALAATPGPTLAAGPRVHMATFDGGEDGFFSEQTGADGAARTEAGAYCLEVTGAERAYSSAWDTGLVDLSLEMEATLREGGAGTAYGYLIRGSGVDASGALAFEVDGQGRWRLRSRGTVGAMEEQIGWTSSPAIDATGTNLLGVIVEGAQATWFVNGEEVARVDDLPPGGTTIGLLVSTPTGQASGKACFDRLRVEELGAAPHDDRQRVTAELGMPQAFELAFGTDEEGAAVRYETWIYYDYLTALTFIDGTLVEEEPLEPVETLAVAPAWYSPSDFDADTTLAQVEALLGEGDLAQVSVPPELGQDMVLYAGEQIVVGFTMGRLEYVETLALQGIEEAGEP